MKLEQFSTLADRLANVSTLREHHVWEAADSLDIDAFDDRSRPFRKRFGALMDADALLDAVLMLAAACKPPRAIEAVRHHDGRWICSMHGATAAGTPKGRAEHADLAAAMLVALIWTFRRPASLRRPRRVSPLPPNRISSHDH